MKTFEELWDYIKEDNLMGYEKSKNLYDELKTTKNLNGNTAEVGVYKGKTSKLIHLFHENKKHYCYDTFEGVALSDSSIDFHKNGDFNCSIEKTKDFLGIDNVIYKKGIFPFTFKEEKEKFIFVHSDTDTYAGAKATLDCFSKTIVYNGIILFDDYHFKCIKKAIKEFMSKNNSFSFKKYKYQFVLTNKNIKLI